MVVCDGCGENLSAPWTPRVDIEPRRSGIYCCSLNEDYEMTRKRSYCFECWLELINDHKTSGKEEKDGHE